MGIFDTIQEESTFSRGSGISYQYVVLQVTLKEKFIGTGSGNLTELEKVINETGSQGIPSAYYLHHKQRQQRHNGRRPYSGNHGI